MRLVSMAVLCVLVGCGDPGGPGEIDAGDTGEPDAAPPQLDGPCAFTSKVGVFEIAHWPLYSAVTGQVADSVHPMSKLEPAETEGSCRLLRRPNPFCDPPCGASNVCDLDGMCKPYPRNMNAGTVTVTGLLADVAVEANASNAYSNWMIPNPAFAPDSPIRLVAPGADAPGFVLEGYGVTPVGVPNKDWTVMAGQDLVVTWDPADDEGEIRVTLNVDQHGTAPATMYCDFEDTGSGTIPAGLLDALLGYGISGIASGYVYRTTVDSVAITQGCVELNVYSATEADVTVSP